MAAGIRGDFFFLFFNTFTICQIFDSEHVLLLYRGLFEELMNKEDRQRL